MYSTAKTLVNLLKNEVLFIFLTTPNREMSLVKERIRRRIHQDLGKEHVGGERIRLGGVFRMLIS